MWHLYRRDRRVSRQPDWVRRSTSSGAVAKQQHGCRWYFTVGVVDRHRRGQPRTRCRKRKRNNWRVRESDKVQLLPCTLGGPLRGGVLSPGLLVAGAFFVPEVSYACAAANMSCVGVTLPLSFSRNTIACDTLSHKGKRSGALLTPPRGSDALPAPERWHGSCRSSGPGPTKPMRGT